MRQLALYTVTCATFENVQLSGSPEANGKYKRGLDIFLLFNSTEAQGLHFIKSLLLYFYISDMPVMCLLGSNVLLYVFTTV